MDTGRNRVAQRAHSFESSAGNVYGAGDGRGDSVEVDGSRRDLVTPYYRAASKPLSLVRQRSAREGPGVGEDAEGGAERGLGEEWAKKERGDIILRTVFDQGAQHAGLCR